MPPGSMREQAANRILRQQVAGDAAKGPLPEAGMPIGARHDQVDVFILDETKQRIRHTHFCRSQSFSDRLDSMSSKIVADVLDAAHGLITSALNDFDDHDGISYLEDRQRIEDGAASLAHVLPSDRNVPERK